MTKIKRYRIRLILLIILALFCGWFVNTDLRFQLFDIPIRESQKLMIMDAISKAVANDTLLGEDHWPMRKTWVCLWGLDSWTYESTRSWTAISKEFDQSFSRWIKRPVPMIWHKAGIIYASRSSPFYLELEYGDAANSYIVRLFTNDPASPHCGPD